MYSPIFPSFLHLLVLSLPLTFPSSFPSSPSSFAHPHSSSFPHSRSPTHLIPPIIFPRTRAGVSSGDAHAASVHAGHLRDPIVPKGRRQPPHHPTQRRLARMPGCGKRGGGGTSEKDHASPFRMGHRTHYQSRRLGKVVVVIVAVIGVVVVVVVVVFVSDNWKRHIDCACGT